MEKLNDLVELAKKVLSPTAAFAGVDAKFKWIAKANPTAILAIAEEFRVLEQKNSELRQQRAGLSREANELESKLAEMDKQEPVAWQCNAHGLMQTEDKEQAARWIKKGWKVWPLFTRPAPAINLADLVPEERNFEHYWKAHPDMPMGDAIIRAAEWEACRAAILRKIEESGLSKPAAPEVE